MAYRKRRAYRKKRSYRPRRRTFRRSYKKAYRNRYVNWAAPPRRYEEAPKPGYLNMAGESAAKNFGAKLGNVLVSAAGTSAVLLLGQGRRLLSSLL